MREGYSSCFVCVNYHASCDIPGVYEEIKVPLGRVFKVSIVWTPLKTEVMQRISAFFSWQALDGQREQ